MAGSEQYVDVGGHRLRLTNLDKVMYPETGTTKAEIIEYYSRVADVLIPHAKDRPVTRKRWVDGVGTVDDPGEVFFQKDLDAGTPSWVDRRGIQHSDSVKEYPLANDLATLVWLAQIASLELHVPQWRFGRSGTRKNPDRLVLDLDPGPGAGLAECVEVAHLVRDLLSGMGLDPLPVTSGSKGIHLYARLDGRQSSDDVSAVAHELARSLEADHPDLVVSDMRKSLRAGKVLVDWSQNNGSKTTIVPYSLRGRPHPTVAAPRTWDELDADLRQLTFEEVLERVESTGDPLAGLSAVHLGDDLAEYRSMRDGSRTPEPMGGDSTSPITGEGNGFVIQEHHATRLHHDFRLERDGVLVSWAVPKGVPADPGVNHLAVHTEDHPLEYASFEGTIPKGEYGAGEVTIWDRGTYELEKWRDDEVIVTIHGERHGSHRLALIRTEGKNWLLHRMKDQRSAGGSVDAAVSTGSTTGGDPRGVSTGSTAGRGSTTGGGSTAGRGSAARGRRFTRGKTVVGTRTGGGGVLPMLASADEVDGFARRLDEEPGRWAFEMKWDGYRAIATVRGDEVELRSRNGLDFTPTYPELAAIADAIDVDAVLDGEIVALDERGRPSFGALQQRSGLTNARDVERARRRVPVRFFAFDVLELDGRDTTSLPYDDRRELLREAVRDSGPVVVPPGAGDDLRDALDTSRAHGLEGVIAKRRDSRYRKGRRSRDWIKLKHLQTQEVVVAGWRPGNGARADTIGSLLLGVPDGDGLRYVGRVGTGFGDRELTQLRSRLDRLSRQTSPLDDVPREDARDARWVTPRLVGEVTYGERTSDGRLRHPVWRGWRPDKEPDEVVLEPLA